MIRLSYVRLKRSFREIQSCESIDTTDGRDFFNDGALDDILEVSSKDSDDSTENHPVGSTVASSNEITSYGIPVGPNDRLVLDKSDGASDSTCEGDEDDLLDGFTDKKTSWFN